MYKKGLSVSLISNIIAMLVSLGISFLLTPFLISNLGKDTYSFFPLANNFVGYLNIISIAVNSMAARFITVNMVEENDIISKGYFSTVFFANLILCAFLLVPMTIIIAFLDKILDVPNGIITEIRWLFFYIFLSLLVQLLFSVFGVATFAKERMDLFAYQNIFVNVLRALLYLFIFKVCSPSIVVMGIVTLAVTFSNGIIQLFFSKIILPEYKINIRLFNIKYMVDLVSSGFWNSINNLGSSLLQTMMLLLANVFVSVEAAGDLSIVQTLPNLMTTVICTVYGVLLPRITNVYAKGDIVLTTETIKYSQKILGLVSSVPVVVILLWGKSFFSLWVPGENSSYLQMLSIIVILPLLIHSAMWTVYGANVINNKLKIPACLYLIVGIINVIVTIVILKFADGELIVIPLISSVLNILFYLLFIPYYAAKGLGIKRTVFYPHIIKTIVFATIMYVCILPISSFLMVNNWATFFVCVLCTEFVGLVLYIIIVLDKATISLVFECLSRIIRRKDLD